MYNVEDARSNWWIVDVMNEQHTVMSSAEAPSEEEAMRLAQTTASALYGSRSHAFEYTVYPPNAGRTL